MYLSNCVYVELSNENIIAEEQDPTELIQQIWDWKCSELSTEDIISRLRSKTVPCGYPIHNWRDGEINYYYLDCACV